jgi:hypothetical protein
MICAGLGRGGTAAAVRFLIAYWKKINELSAPTEGNFSIVLEWMTDDFKELPERRDVRLAYPYDWKKYFD